MSNIKIWGKKLWKVVASGNSTGIATTNPGLLKDGETAISVYEAIERLTDWMITSKGYIAWLKKNGGGGGGGGGSDVTEATCTITVRGTESAGVESGGTVVLGSNGIDITIATEVTTRKAWAITVRVGSTPVASGSASYDNPTLHVSADKINKALSNHSGTLAINASYEDETKGVYGASTWTGSIVENSVVLVAANTDTTLEGLSAKQITYQFSVGYLGNTSAANYRLHLTMEKEGKQVKTYEEELRITNTNTQSKDITLLGTLFDSVSNDNIGVYDITATLTAIDNSTITASAKSTLTIASENILIASSAMTRWTDASAEYPTTSIAGSLNIAFTAYVQGRDSYSCDIFVDGVEVRSGAVGYFGREYTDVISVANKDWATIGLHQVKVVVTSADKTATAIFGTQFVEASASLLQERATSSEHLISSLVAREHNGEGASEITFNNPAYNNGGTIYSLTSKYVPVNNNSLSVVTTDSAGVPYLRLSNGASAKLSTWKYGNTTKGFNDFFNRGLTQIKQFTMSICFKADYHADDDRTILFCGVANSQTGNITKGISIDVHDIYINEESVYKLTDNTINMVDIVVLQTTTDKPLPDGGTEEIVTYIFKVYLDGVLTATRSIENFPTFSDEIFLGSRHYNVGTQEVYSNLCDCNIYNLQIYDTALTDYDIMIKYINNTATTNYLNGEPNFSLINTELRKNFCYLNGDTVVSNLYNPTADKYSVDFLVQESTEGIVLNQQNLADYGSAIGIPIVLIDVSADSSWTFNAFAAQQTYSVDSANILGSDNVRCQYWDPNGSNQQIVTLPNISIKLQGHSTLADFVKNINITVPDDLAFIPKEDWFPEQTYTLKADVVDSSHSNNAAIGTFINEVLGPDSDGNNPFLPFDQTALDNVYKSNYKKNQQTGVTLKHTVTGFPVLVIMKFYTAAEGDVSVTPLGIYSFNLGRDAIRNLGFRKVNSITWENGTQYAVTVFPFVSKVESWNETDSEANWIEIEDTSLMDISALVDELPEDLDSSLGDFWQDDDNILNNRFDVKFGSRSNPSEYQNFKTFVSNIMRLPISGCTTSANNGVITRPEITGSYNLYTCDTQGNNYKPTGSKRTLIRDTSQYTDNLGFEPESFYKYFVTGLLFGLVDNFGKNSTYRSWNNGKYYIDFYDLDSGNGGSNQGELTIGPDMWLTYLYNKPEEGKTYGFINETFDSDKSQSSSGETKVSANQNKIWLSLDTPTAREVLSQGAANSVYTTYWYQLRTFLQSKAEAAGYAYDANHPTNQIVEWFINEYFAKQTGDCGPLLFNYDYKLKYLLQFTDDSYKSTKALTKLHGRKIAYTKDWLNKHIHFLDSLFSWRDAGQSKTFRNNVDTAGANNVLKTREDFTLMTNCPVVLFNAIGDATKTYYFAQANKETYVNAGKNGSNSILTWNLSNSPNIIQFGNDDILLKDMHVTTMAASENTANIDFNGYPSIADLNFAGNQDFSGFNLKAFTTGAISEIRTLDFSDTAGDLFPLNLTYNEGAGTWFTKLTKIDIHNSKCVSALSIPSIPLKELNVRGSAIQSFELKNQAYLSSVDLTDCKDITKVAIENCANYEELSLDNLTELTSVSVLRNPSLKTIKIASCINLKTLHIEGCDSLQSIEVTNCTGLVDDVSITSCGGLVTINFSGCSNLTTFEIAQSNQTGIKTLNLASTKVSYISGDGVTTSYLDLYKWGALTSVSLRSNSEVVNIQFANNQDSPIALANTFLGCTKLERVWGNLNVKTSAIFQDCANFSIHGPSVNSVRFKGLSVTDSAGRVKMPYEIVGQSLDNFNMETHGYQSGTGVTNMRFGTSNLNKAFQSTNCTTFDIYYVMSAATNVTAMDSIFYTLQNNPFYWTASVDNSPNRYMFHWATKVTNLGAAFTSPRSSNSSNPTYIRLFSPTVTSEGVINEDGLFSPLKNSLALISQIFSGYSFVTDRYLFRLPSGNYQISNMSCFNPSQLVDGICTSGYRSLATIQSAIAANPEGYGDFSLFYHNLPKMTGTAASHMAGMYYINFDTLSGIPMTQLNCAFITTYGSGDITPASLFATPQSVYKIDYAFRVNNALTIGTETYQAQLPITDDTLKLFTRLVHLSHNGSGSDGIGAMGCVSGAAFYGSGINKYINQNSFPYDILQSCKSRISGFTSFFMGCKKGSLSRTPSLPGTLFAGATNLSHCTGLFMNVDFEYKLSGEGFADCSNLRGVAYLFAVDENTESKITGSIPTKLFYHGISAHNTSTEWGLPVGSTVTVESGADTDGAFTKSTIVKNGTTYYMFNRSGVLTWFDAGMNATTKEAVLDSAVLDYDVYRRGIIDMAYCFQGANLTPYSNTSPTAEANSAYMPFEWRLEGNSFTKDRVDTNKQTAIWNYDGVNRPSDSSIEILDVSTSAVATDYFDVGSNTSRGGTMQFCCAPDLLRYCSNSCSVQYLFNACGHNVPSSSYGNSFSKSNYGLKGRIPPYLLYPLIDAPSVSLKGMFRNCKVLNAYTLSGSDYMIPADFFTYCTRITSLESTFEGMTFPKNIRLDVFSAIESSTLTTVRQVFYMPYFYGHSSTNRLTISNVFNNKRGLSNTYRAFAPTYNGNNQSVKIVTQYVNFVSIFPTGRYNTASYNNNTNFAETFAWYNSSVTHEPTKTLVDNITVNNYKLYGT